MRNRLSCAISALFTFGVSTAAVAGDITFTEAPVPVTDEQKRAILSSESVTVDGVQVPFDYQIALRSGDTAANEPNGFRFGQLYDINGMPLMAEDGSAYIANSNDFSSFLEGDDGNLYMVSHFESRPGAIYLTEMAQDSSTGQLTALRTRPLDFSSVNGGWVHCAGSVTPWGTHLGSEEYEPDAKQWRDNEISDYNAAMARYFGADPADAGAVMNPYDYGYPIEIDVANYDQVELGKHYAMGRIALELGYVMPDQKTVYMSDDGTNVGLFRFVADRPGDLSSGTLWVAQWNQKSAAGAGSATISWIPLGWANNQLVRDWISAYTFADIFDEAEPVMENGEDTGTCPSGYTSINAGHGGGDHQCLALRDVDGDGAVSYLDAAIASRLETRRWAAMQGGTTEFRKMEGITYSPDHHRLFIAMSEVDRGMRDFERAGRESPYEAYDIGGPNHMTLTNGNVCGAVYALHLDGTYAAVDMFPIVAGTPLTVDYGAAADSPEYDGINKCDLEGIANPDNITYMPGYHTLIIGEDTGSGHQNDMIWAFNTETSALTRIQTTPYGSETTSPYFYPNINGFAYLKSVVQHPYGESDQDQLTNPNEKFGYTGYFVLPAMDN